MKNKKRGKQEFEHNEEMYSVKTLDSEGKEGELVVSPEHKVYVNYKSKNFLTSLSSNTLTKNCFFNFGSLVQIGALSNVNDKANNGVSFKCGHISSALVSNISIFYKPCFLATPSLILLDNSLASFSDNLDFEAIDLSSCFCNSTLAHCSNDLSNSSLVRKVLTNLSASSAYSSGICNLKLNSCILTNNNDKSNLNSFRLEKDISSLMKDKTRGYELSEGSEDIDSSERDYIDDERSESSRRKTEESQSSMSSRIVVTATSYGKIMGGGWWITKNN